MRPRRAVGVDWSGAADPRAAARAIWLAVVEDGALVALEHGRDREATLAHLVELVLTEPETVIGLDFCFSAPAWFLAGRGMRSAGELWRWAASGIDADAGFVRGLPAPFWGPGIRAAPAAGGDRFRATEHAIAAAGARPGSIFRLSGPGAVGAQSLYGMPALLSLCDAGVAIWPFDPPALPCAVEVFPRALARFLAPAGTRLRGAALRRAVAAAAADALGPWRARVEANQDAFDAAVTALVLGDTADLLEQLAAARAGANPLEGAIFVPGGH